MLVDVCTSFKPMNICLENATLSRISSFRSLIWCELLISRGYRGNRFMKCTETTMRRDINCNQKMYDRCQENLPFSCNMWLSYFYYYMYYKESYNMIILRTYFLFIVYNTYMYLHVWATWLFWSIKNMTKSLTLNIQHTTYRRESNQ